MKDKLKREKGITLIALIITIIIMLILAGVSISIIKNQGIITKSNEAVEKYNQSAEGEQANLTEMEKKIDKYSNNKWWELTEEEKTDIELGSGIGMIAVKGDEFTAGYTEVLLSKDAESVIVAIKTDSGYDIYAYYFGEEEGTLGSTGMKLEKNKTWYYINTDGSTVLSKEEYNEASPIKKEDFVNGEIASETYLQRVINSFNN